MFKKGSPVSNTVEWWKCVFEADATIDVKNIADRSGSSVQKNWDEAMTSFKSKVARNKPMAIDLVD